MKLIDYFLSLALYELNGLKFPWVTEYTKQLTNHDKKLVKNLKDKCLAKGTHFTLAGRRFDCECVKNNLTERSEEGIFVYKGKHTFT